MLPKVFSKKSRQHVLIDYENTKDLTVLAGLTKKDFVYLLYSKNSETVNFSNLERLQTCKAKIHYQPVHLTGANSLDFQLSSYVGYLIAYFPKDSFVIVSKDKGYDCVVKFWEDKGIKICRRGEIQLPLPDGEDFPRTEEVAAIVNQYQGFGKNAVHLALTQAFGQEQGLAAYNKVKDSLPSISNQSITNNMVQEIVANHGSKGKDAVYQALIKALGQERGLAEYKKVKKSL